MNGFMPVQASTWAAQVDWINWLITVIAIFCTVAVTGVMLYFAVKHRRKSDKDETPYITHNTSLETVWTVIPTIIVIYMFYYGTVVYREMRTPPANSIEINVSGYSWGWNFEYPNGKVSAAELVVPLGQPVRLIMRSQDVIHSFFVPALRIKEDVLGNIYTYLWFNPIVLGDFHIFCAEYCGMGHSGMLGTLKVVTPEQYQDYLVDKKPAGAVELPPLELGKKLFSDTGCKTCHSIDGTASIGPTLKGVFGHKVELVSGETVDADENYLHESLVNPAAKIVKGFQPVMPPQAGLSEKDLAGLIAYIKSLSEG